MTETVADIRDTLLAIIEEERRAALHQHKWRKITARHEIAGTALQFETVVEENATAEEIFAALAPIEDAVDRFQAKLELIMCYRSAENECKQIELAVQTYYRQRHDYETENAKHNATRRNTVGLNAGQIKNLQGQRETIKEKLSRVDEYIAEGEKLKTFIAGDNRLSSLEAEVRSRLHALRGERQDAA